MLGATARRRAGEDRSRWPRRRAARVSPKQVAALDDAAAGRPVVAGPPGGPRKASLAETVDDAVEQPEPARARGCPRPGDAEGELDPEPVVDRAVPRGRRRRRGWGRVGSCAPVSVRRTAGDQGRVEQAEAAEVAGDADRPSTTTPLRVSAAGAPDRRRSPAAATSTRNVGRWWPSGAAAGGRRRPRSRASPRCGSVDGARQGVGAVVQDGDDGVARGWTPAAAASPSR